jgi:hypothetical protein
VLAWGRDAHVDAQPVLIRRFHCVFLMQGADRTPLLAKVNEEFRIKEKPER